MNREKTPGKQLPHGTGAERDSLGSQLGLAAHSAARREHVLFCGTEPA